MHHQVVVVEEKKIHRISLIAELQAFLSSQCLLHWPLLLGSTYWLLRVEVGALGWNHGVAMASRVLVSNNRAMST